MSKENEIKEIEQIIGINLLDASLKSADEHSLLQVQQPNNEILAALQPDKPGHPCHIINTFHVRCGLQLNSEKFSTFPEMIKPN